MQKRFIHLVPITELETDSQLAIREIRNEPEVRRVMYTDHVIGINEHLQWIGRLKTDTRQIVFGIVDACGNRPLGVISLSAIDFVNRRSDWGFYLAPAERGFGLGTVVKTHFLKFAFENLGLEKLNGTVLEGNQRVVHFYQKFGCKEEGFREAEILRNEKRVGVHLLGLEKEAWVQNHAALSETYRDAFERFTIEVHWSPADKSLTPIDQIEAARARNNVNWMNILRIAVEKSPVNAKQIVAEIKEIDQQISALTAQINLEP